MDQIPFGTNDFALNPEPRVACVLLLDISGSMAGERIRSLNEGLAAYREEVLADSLAAKRVEVAIVTFGGTVAVNTEFTTVAAFTPPTLEASGDTPMGAGMLKAIEMVEARKLVYKPAGIQYYRPWIFLITDGAPTDSWMEAAAKVKEREAAKAIAFFSVGVDGADFNVLKQLSSSEPLRLKGLSFRELFKWLSSSQSAVSRSAPGEQVPLVNPTGPQGWASV